MARKLRTGICVLVMALLVAMLVAGCGGGGGSSEGKGVASMSQGRWGHTATRLEDGLVLVVGGQETPAVALSSAERYDLSTGKWSPAGDTRLARGEGHTATLLKDGRVLVVGSGYSTEIYDPVAGKWSDAGDMSEDRTWHTATLLKDGRVLVTGGLSGRLSHDSAELYDPATGEWSLAGTMSQKYEKHVAALLPDGRVLLVGKDAADVFNPSTGTWTPASRPAGIERFWGYRATILDDGRVMITGGAYSTGGYSGYGAGYKALNTADIFDPATETWSAASPMLGMRRLHAATPLQDGRVLVVGGLSTETYDPAANTWTSAGDMNVERLEGHTATLLEDGRVLVVGGRKDAQKAISALWEGGSGRAAVEIYDPATGW